ncbi:hypothetical protein L6E12_08280 [Actinokineospora sp. PR83]|uniref:EF-hand domain-containing protein n=1 Tax=Actinokineospora sp. PR83 TaxID=2884908 RepID=UPI001F3A6AD4|nr:EF-hand domain-containing protein [Actinokineospora sp. PR83]MCG8915784.1 hypothetical protein [Actinokineospora sp. PR83]
MSTGWPAVAREFGPAENSPGARGLAGGYGEIWEYVRGADLDVDGVVDAAEFREAHTSGRVTTEVPAEKWIAAMDADENGRVDWAELSANVRGLFTATDGSAKGARVVSGN